MSLPWSVGQPTPDPLLISMSNLRPDPLPFGVWRFATPRLVYQAGSHATFLSASRLLFGYFCPLTRFGGAPDPLPGRPRRPKFRRKTIDNLRTRGKTRGRPGVLLNYHAPSVGQAGFGPEMEQLNKTRSGTAPKTVEHKINIIRRQATASPGPVFDALCIYFRSS